MGFGAAVQALRTAGAFALGRSDAIAGRRAVVVSRSHSHKSIMKILCTLAALLALCGPAYAQEAGVQLDYEAFVAGFNVMKVHAGIDLRPDHYGIGLHVRTAGAMGAFVRGDTLTRVEGGFRGPAIQPQGYRSGGMWRGDPHIVNISYEAGQPVVHTLLPSNQDDKREPVPPEATRNTIDSISAVALLMHNIATTGRCESQATTYDGRRVSQVTVRTVAQEILPEESRSSFQGQALHCQIEGHQTAGFPHDAGPDDYSRRPQAADVWLAALTPGGPILPVLMEFPTKYMGRMRVYITEVKRGVNMAEFTPSN